MPWFDFFWHEENLRKLAEHGVTAAEFEQVVTAAGSVEESDSGSDMVRGETNAGRFLICIFTMLDEMTILPITAYEPSRGAE